MSGDVVVRVRLVGTDRHGVHNAGRVLVDAVANLPLPVELELRPERKGRNGEWLVYGRMRMASAPDGGLIPEVFLRECDP